jgi:tryptophanyl-tRNA synthetase
MSIVTDSTPVEQPKPVKGSPLYALLRLFAPADERDWVERAFAEGGTGYGDMKKRLFGYFMETFGVARARYEEMLADPSEIDRILAQGARRARETAVPLVEKVRETVGIR